MVVLITAKGHPIPGAVGNITSSETDSWIAIKWQSPPPPYCNTTYKYVVEYEDDSNVHREEVTNCEYRLSNLNPNTSVRFSVVAVCTCCSSASGPAALFTIKTSKVLYVSICTEAVTYIGIFCSRHVSPNERMQTYIHRVYPLI